MAKKGLNVMVVLIVLAGAVLILSGLGRFVHADSFFGRMGRSLGTESSMINLVLAFIELAAGIIVVADQFISLGGVRGLLKLGACIGYAVVIVLTLILGGALKPDSLGWWISLAQSGVILTVLWVARGE